MEENWQMGKHPRDKIGKDNIANYNFESEEFRVFTLISSHFAFQGLRTKCNRKSSYKKTVGVQVIITRCEAQKTIYQQQFIV